MHFEIYRSGALVYRYMTFDSLSVSETLNAIDSATLTFPSPWCILEGDELWLYDNGAVFKFAIVKTEPTLDADNVQLTKASMDALVGRVMACTAIPTESIVTGSTLGDLTDVLEQLAFLEQGVVITIQAAAGESLLTAHGIQTQALDAIGALRDIVTGAALRWRTRSDLPLTVEYGVFGESSGFAVRESNEASDYDGMVAKGVYPASVVSGYYDITETVDVLVPEGGKYALPGGQQVPLQINLAVAPAGFTITARVFLGQTFYTLEKDGNTGTCWKKIIISNLVPEGDPPDSAQHADASQTLADAAARYLNDYNAPLRHFNVSIPYSTLGKFLVGSRVVFAAKGLNCGGAYQGDIFVASRTTTWGGDNTVSTELELSTRLESLQDPLSAEFGPSANHRRIIDAGTSFQVCGIANPNVIIPFGQTFSAPPTVVALQNGTATVTVVNITTTDVELNAVPIFPNVLPLQVCALVYPP